MPDPTAHLPLKAEDFHILLALEDADRHGYAILKAIEDTTAGRVRMAPSPFYRKLKRLADDGLLVEADERPAPELDDDRRRYYRLTPWGREVLEAEALRLVELAGRPRVVELARSGRGGGSG